MPLVKRFEDLKAWQEARVLTLQIYHLSGSGAFAQDFDLKDQIRRAAVSATANIAQAAKTKALIGGLKHFLFKRT